MASKNSKGTPGKETKPTRTPVRSPEAQEQLLINLSMKQAEQMLREGRAPSQIVVHFLRLATEKARYENEKLRAETEMARAKSEVLQAQKHYDEIAEKAIQAFTSYGGGKNYSSSYIEEDEDGY